MQITQLRSQHALTQKPLKYFPQMIFNQQQKHFIWKLLLSCKYRYITLAATYREKKYTIWLTKSRSGRYVAFTGSTHTHLLYLIYLYIPSSTDCYVSHGSITCIEMRKELYCVFWKGRKSLDQNFTKEINLWYYGTWYSLQLLSYNGWATSSRFTLSGN
jgi:hypothetical protein